MSEKEYNETNDEEDEVEETGSHENAIKLKLKHVQAGFLLLGVGFLAGGVVLLMEWMFYLFGKRFSLEKWYIQINKVLC